MVSTAHECSSHHYHAVKGVPVRIELQIVGFPAENLVSKDTLVDDWVRSMVITKVGVNQRILVPLDVEALLGMADLW